MRNKISFSCLADCPACRQDKLLGDSLGREWELQQKVEEVSQSLSELSSQHASDMEAFEAFKVATLVPILLSLCRSSWLGVPHSHCHTCLEVQESSEAAILAKQEEVGKLETAVKESILAAKSCEVSTQACHEKL